MKAPDVDDSTAIIEMPRPRSETNLFRAGMLVGLLAITLGLLVGYVLWGGPPPSVTTSTIETGATPGR
jgi:hypothetical protein